MEENCWHDLKQEVTAEYSQNNRKDENVQMSVHMGTFLLTNLSFLILKSFLHKKKNKNIINTG